MEIIKYQSEKVLFHIRHDLRELPDEKSYGNEAIDTSLTKHNYSLVDRGSTAEEINKYRHKIEKEIFRYNRKNIVRACEAVIQCPDDCPPEQHEAFMRESYNYFLTTLPMGERCVLLATVHRDEKHYAPDGSMISKEHIHIMYIPAVPDSKHDGFKYKLCADALTKRTMLLKLHPGLQAHLKKCGIEGTVFRKKDGDGTAISLSTKQLKELTKQTGIKLDHSLTVNELSKLINTNILNQKQLQEFKVLLQKKEAAIESFRESLDNINNQIQLTEEIKQDNLRLKDALDSKNEEIERLKDTILKKDDCINSTNAENISLKKNLADLESSYDKKSEELTSLTQTIEELKKSSEEKPVGPEESIGWGTQSGWGTLDKDIAFDEDVTW